MSKKLFCIIGQTCSGKSTIVKNVANKLGLRILKSYTTRPMRQGETLENSDHTFIQPEDVNQYKNDMVAYTERVDYCSFATTQQLFDNDFYIINPSGFCDLVESTKNLDVELIDVWIQTPLQIMSERAFRRGDFRSWQQNWLKEQYEFASYPYPKTFVINNSGSLEESVEKLIHIIKEKK